MQIPLLNLVLICLVCVLIIDTSGFINSFKSFISKRLTNSKIDTVKFRIPPFDCSFCMNWWSSLIYLIITHQLSLPSITLVLFLSLMSDPIGRLLLLIKDLINKLIDNIYERAF